MQNHICLTPFSRIAAVLFSGLPCVAADAPKQIEFFETKIRPVLVKHCYHCHSSQNAKPKGGLLLDSRSGIRKGGDTGPAVVPGNVDASLLISAIRHEELEMPPKNKLPDDVIANFVTWVKMGAPDARTNQHKEKVAAGSIDGSDHWSFKPPRKVDPPQVQNRDWPLSDIDRFVLARLEKEQVKPVGDAELRTLIRRLYFDLIGLPPSLEELERWTDRLTSQINDQALRELVDQLLESPHFGERWARYWLDVARFAESNGNADNTPFPFAWRYRDYVIAALNADKPYDLFVREQIAGDLLPADSKGQRDEHLVATGFLALASKPRAQNNPDYEMDLVADQIDVTSRAVLGLTVLCARCHDHKFDPIPTREYYALAGIFRSSWVLAGGATETGGKKKEPLLGDGFHVLSNKSEAMGVRESEPVDCQVCLGGDSEQLGELVPRGFLTALSVSKMPINRSQSGRMQLARWLTSSDNPLTPRVAVNRIWYRLFGRGLVTTLDNFGTLGERPSHPELLDWLAVKFIHDGWSIKRMIRSIVLSRTYRLASSHDATNFEYDPDNVLLWRMNRRRLDAEAIRDAMLAVSGQLDRSPPERSMLPDPPKKGWQRRIEQSNHRSVYQGILRDLPMSELLRVFDVADPNLIIARRDSTNVPTQALALISGQFAVSQAEIMAQRILQDGAGESDEQRVELIYRLAYARSASDEEKTRALSYLSEYAGAASSKDPKQAKLRAWTSFCKAIVASAEFRYIE